MRRWVLFSALAVAAAWAGQAEFTREVAAAPRVRVTSAGAIELAPGATRTVRYSVKVAGAPVRVVRQGEWVTIAAPRAVWMRVEIPAQARAVAAWSSGGSIKAGGLRCAAELTTGAGDIEIGVIEGAVRAAAAVGRIRVDTIGGDATLQTGGGDITARQIGGTVDATTAGGAVRIAHAGGIVLARSGGGPVEVGQAGGAVTVRSLAGAIDVGPSESVQCESAAGAIRLAGVRGSVRASTEVGSIVANLLAGKAAGESFLATGNGDIFVYIPSNLGVNVLAANALADSVRRIVSEFPGVPVRLQGTQVVAEGAINGGGPLLRINGANGTIYIRRLP
jgi:hypothetical protein